MQQKSTVSHKRARFFTVLVRNLGKGSCTLPSPGSQDLKFSSSGSCGGGRMLSSAALCLLLLLAHLANSGIRFSS